MTRQRSNLGGVLVLLLSGLLGAAVSGCTTQPASDQAPAAAAQSSPAAEPEPVFDAGFEAGGTEEWQGEEEREATDPDTPDEAEPAAPSSSASPGASASS